MVRISRDGRDAQGRSLFEEGFLPVYSVDTEAEAKDLVLLACKRSVTGELIAPELAEEQTLDRLASFGDRLQALHQGMKKRAAR